MKLGAKEILFRLLLASSEEEVKNLIEDNHFSRAVNWRPYGDYSANFNVFHNQQRNQVAALVEKAINSIDHILLKECKLRGIDPKSSQAPQFMQKAVEEFFGIKSGDFSEVGQKRRRELASIIKVIAEGSMNQPNIITVDNGEGQHPAEFPHTFLSLHRENKIDIPFVQGKYNMGGTGVLRFCGQYHYQLILSRKTPQLLESNQNDEWGFTLVRLHPAGPQDKHSWYEYLVNADGDIPSFPGESLQILPNGELLDSGTYIKLFNYKLKKPWSVVLDLWRDMAMLLFLPALPILIYENRDIKDMHGRSRVMLGNKIRTMIDERGKVEDSFLIEAELGAFGKRNIEITLFKEGTSKTEYTNPNSAIFFTINGQTHAMLSRSFLKAKAKANL